MRERLGLDVRQERLLPDARGLDLHDHLPERIERYLPLAVNINTEAAKSELLVAPLILAFKLRHPSIAMFSGVGFDVEPAFGLLGPVGFLLSRDPCTSFPHAPVCLVAETVNHDVHAALPPCLAAMEAARRFNHGRGLPIPTIHGLVTNGTRWRFLTLAGTTATIDYLDYPIEDARKIFGILTHVVLGPGAA